MTFKELRYFLQSLLSDMTGQLVIFQRQNAPKPSKSYLAIRLYGYRSLGQDDILPGEVDGEVIVKGPREVTLEVQWIGEDGLDGLHKLQQKLSAPTIVDRCFFDGVSIYETENIQDISGLMDGADWEHRYSMDLHVRITQQTIDNPGLIEEVNIRASGLGNDTNININAKEEGN